MKIDKNIKNEETSILIYEDISWLNSELYDNVFGEFEIEPRKILYNECTDIVEVVISLALFLNLEHSVW